MYILMKQFLRHRLFTDVLEPDIIEDTPLTSGDWEVINKQVLLLYYAVTWLEVA